MEKVEKRVEKQKKQKVRPERFFEEDESAFVVVKRVTKKEQKGK